MKGFFNTFLQLIQRKLDPNNYDYYDPKWANDPIFSTLAGDDKHFTFLDKPNKFTKKEAKLGDNINAALEKIFGFTGLFMLRTGLLSFSLDTDGNYKCHNLIPKTSDSVKIFRAQKITALNILDAEIGGKNYPVGSYGKDMFDSSENRISKLLAILLTGYRVSLELVDEQGRDLNTFLFIKNRPNFQYHEKRFVNFDPNEANRDDIDAMVRAFVKGGLYRKIPKVELFYDSCEILIENLYKKVIKMVELKKFIPIPGRSYEDSIQMLMDEIRKGITGPRGYIRYKINDLIKHQIAGDIVIQFPFQYPPEQKIAYWSYQFSLDPNFDVDIYDNPKVHRFGDARSFINEYYEYVKEIEDVE